MNNDKSNFTMNIGPGNTIGAMAFGEGAKASGSVTVGGSASQDVRLKAMVDVRGSTSMANLANSLEAAALSIREGSKIGAIGSVTGATPQGVAWEVSEDK